jgi:hypothetical protein
MLNILRKNISSSQIGHIGMALEYALRLIPPNNFVNQEQLCAQYAFFLVTLSTFTRQIRNHSIVILQSILMLATELVSDP